MGFSLPFSNTAMLPLKSLTIYDKLLFEVVGGASALFTSSCGFLYKTIDKINKNKIAKIMPKTTFFRTISPHSKS